MVAAETTEGLARLGIVHHTTLPYSPRAERQARGASGRRSRAGSMRDARGRGRADAGVAQRGDAGLGRRASTSGAVHRRAGHVLAARAPRSPARAVVRPSPASDRPASRLPHPRSTRAVRHSDGTFTARRASASSCRARYRTLTRVTVRVRALGSHEPSTSSTRATGSPPRGALAARQGTRTPTRADARWRRRTAATAVVTDRRHAEWHRPAPAPAHRRLRRDRHAARVRAQASASRGRCGWPRLATTTTTTTTTTTRPPTPRRRIAR
jgi:hypothetical protein